jgi:hypothetical protein
MSSSNARAHPGYDLNPTGRYALVQVIFVLGCYALVQVISVTLPRCT